ncbi:hypothetical protein ACFFX0_20295 [Citricoccus parietis]|uniref:Uncharacterized protein n=1 Tax=Citricoccus parietis TaxID=592307 RepID=A0ABV5G396_9MICC
MGLTLTATILTMVRPSFSGYVLRLPGGSRPLSTPTGAACRQSLGRTEE